MKWSVSSVFLMVGCVLSPSLFFTPAKAQVTPDGTTNSTVNAEGNNFTIENGDRAGSNLFHSFSDFSVPNNGSAFFDNATDITNIFSRVTGGNISNIDGLIRANDANLFLINPAGILFGAGARLDLGGGSFYGSSADSILFEDGEFSATDFDNPPLLTINAPIGLGFRDNPADINVRGNGNGVRLLDSEVIDTQDALRVDSDATIGIVGGNLIFEDATIKTAGGRIELGSVAGGRVGLVEVANGFTFDYSGVETFRDISISGTNSIDASGLGGGDIQVAGRNISINDSSAIIAHTLGSNPGGDINILAIDTLEISGVENDDNLASGIANRVYPNGTADGGDINIETGNLRLNNRAFIRTSTLGQGNAGNITINASDSILLESQESPSEIASNVTADAVGNAGDIKLTTPSLTISNGAFLSAASAGQGNAGNITVNAADLIILEGQDANSLGNTGISSSVSSNLAEGNAGNIELNTGSLTINNGAGLFAINSSLGAGGNITINATDDVSFTNGSSIFVTGTEGGSLGINARKLSITSGSQFFAGINIDSGFPDAQAGDIVINLTEDLVLDGLDGERVTSIDNVNFGTGNAGNIEISAGNITFSNGGKISSSTDGIGNIGNINLQATGDILFDGIRGINRSGIENFVNQEGIGDVGEISITAQNLAITNGANIQSAVSGTANSGDINLNVADSISVDGFGLAESEDISGELGSGIASNVVLGIGNSGNVNIDTQNLSLSGNGFVSSQILGQGNAGNINITAKTITVDGEGNQNISPSEIRSDTLSILSDSPGAEANGGNIFLSTDSLFLINGGSIDAENGVIGNGEGGSIEINARERILIDGTGVLLSNGEENQIPSGIFVLSSDVIGNSGNIEINTPQLSVTDGAEINAFTRGQGNAGSIIINTPEFLQLTGDSSINTSVESEATGNGGNLSIETGELTFTGNSAINASTRGQGNAGSLAINATEFIELNDISFIIASVLNNDAVGNGGNIEINTPRLSITDGAQINASTRGQGNAGDLTITASEFIELKGNTDNGRSGLFAGTLEEDGNGGNLQIFTKDLIVGDGAIVSVSNFPSIEGTAEPGTGEAGNLILEAKSLNLENGGRIDAATQAGNGGNITLQIADDLTLRDESFISARAFNDADGGNITIDTRFIVAFPNGNNDIVANAEQGNGGNINITAESLFGIEERPLNPETNDINASSEFGLDGSISIFTPDFNRVQTENQLPTNPIENEETTAQACQSDRLAEEPSGSLTIKGKGGIPPQPTEPFASGLILVDGIITTSNPRADNPDIKPVKTSSGDIIPARGIIKTENGQVILTAYRTDNPTHRTPHIRANCTHS